MEFIKEMIMNTSDTDTMDEEGRKVIDEISKLMNIEIDRRDTGKGQWRQIRKIVEERGVEGNQEEKNGDETEAEAGKETEATKEAAPTAEALVATVAGVAEATLAAEAVIAEATRAAVAEAEEKEVIEAI